jgi:hypothetical protein
LFSDWNVAGKLLKELVEELVGKPGENSDFSESDIVKIETQAIYFNKIKQYERKQTCVSRNVVMNVGHAMQRSFQVF